MTASPAAQELVVACNLCRSPVGVEETVFVKDGHQIVRCPRCGLIFRLRLPEPNALSSIYQDSYFRAGLEGGSTQGYLDYIDDAESHRRTARRRLELLERLIQPGRLFDVGCAAGFFLDEATQRGWDCGGVDISEIISSWGRQQLHAQIETGTFLAVERGEPYDTLTMWDYLEHTLDPRAELRKAATLVRPGGVLALSTGDARSWVARISGANWHLLTPQHHNFYFTLPTLVRYLREEAFELVVAKYLWSWYSLAYLTHKLRTMSDRGLLVELGHRVQRSAIGRISIPVNLWDVVTILARKH